VLVTMGGVDKDNVTHQVLEALNACSFPADMRIVVVMGPQAPWRPRVEQAAQHMRYPTRVLAGVDNMARLMVDSDLGIGAAGSTTWERCCLGLPTIQMVLAHNQKEVAEALERLGAVTSVSATGNTLDLLRRSVRSSSVAKMQMLSERAAQICDGRGASIVVQRMLERSPGKRLEK
jgi:spore coat polysaccharide biosynthesis predicted glycosyltransferase SpsG